jgi:hypothetical protein
MRERGDARDVEHLEARIAERLAEEQPRFRSNRGAPRIEIARVDERRRRILAQPRGGEGVPIDVGRRSRSIFLQRAAKRGSSAGSSTGICCPRVGGLRFFGVPGAFENVAKVPEELRHRAVRLDGALDTLPGTLEFAGALL